MQPCNINTEVKVFLTKPDLKQFQNSADHGNKLLKVIHLSKKVVILLPEIHVRAKGKLN